MQLPPELRGPLADAVLEFLVTAGLVRRKFTAMSAGAYG
jgi:hypothetical protein